MLGLFDASGIPAGWFDPLLQAPAWFDADALDQEASAVELAGEAIAGATAEATLGAAADLTGAAVASATAEGSLELEINLAGDGFATAAADAALDVDGDEEQPEPSAGAGGWGVAQVDPLVRFMALRRRRRDEEIVAAMASIH